jgi:hypothetical protein
MNIPERDLQFVSSGHDIHAFLHQSDPIAA